MKKAWVYYRDQKAGVLEQAVEGFRFTYEVSYLQAPSAQPISLSLPLQAESFLSKELFPFFDGMIAEGWLLDITSRVLKIDTEDRFGLLLATASHTIGAVTVKEVENANQ
ncbi:MAG: HipA N-terminal domain-containing protein [Deltaproteobacteria bacterium]|nr:MAG: HipA N-terminal domain-containing protein [Deltaproteobacteria bacterium]